MSADTVQKDPLLSSKEAGALLGYTHDYISKLCRENKMNGVQKGRIWYVTEAEVHAFKSRHEAELEAKKSQLSQKFSEIRSQHETLRQNQPEPSPFMEDVKKRSFVIPREIVAACVLGLLLLAPTFANSLRNTSSSVANIQAPASSRGFFDSSSLVGNLDAGIATVIASHSDLMLKTASTYGFVAYLSDGYWQLALNGRHLGMGFYGFLMTISSGYIALYEHQGQIIYDSIGQTAAMGAHALAAYELTGEAVWIGSKEAINYYSRALNIGSKAEASKKKLNNFALDTSEGAKYAQEQVKVTFFHTLKESITTAHAIVIDNIGSNLYYMAQSINETGSLVTATVHEAFDFEYDGNEKVRKIELTK